MPGDGISAASLPDRETLKLLAQRSNWSATVRVVSHFGSVLAMGAIISWVIFASGIFWALPLILMQGWLVGFLFMPLHETAHKTAFRHQKANLVVGNICAVAVVLPYEYYTLFHWAHHRHTQDPKHDPELAAGLPAPASVSGLAIWFLGVRQLIGRFKLIARHAMTGRVTAPWVPAGKRDLVVVEARLILAVYGVTLIGSILLGTAVLFWTWLLPLIIGQTFLRPYLLAEHSGCGNGRDAFANTRTTFTASFVRWFTWNMPYHTEHHAYPNIPFHALPRLHDAVQGRLEHRGAGYITVTRHVWHWFRQRQA